MRDLLAGDEVEVPARHAARVSSRERVVAGVVSQVLLDVGRVPLSAQLFLTDRAAGGLSPLPWLVCCVVRTVTPDGTASTRRRWAWVLGCGGASRVVRSSDNAIHRKISLFGTVSCIMDTRVRCNWSGWATVHPVQGQDHGNLLR